MKHGKCWATLMVAMLLWQGPAFANGVKDGNDGYDAFINANFDKAISLLTRALASGEASDESMGLLYFTRGQAHYWQKDFAKAAEDFHQAQRYMPTDYSVRDYTRLAEKRISQPPQTNSNNHTLTIVLFGGNAAYRRWIQVDPLVQDCLTYKYGQDPIRLAADHTGPDIGELRDPIGNCMAEAEAQRLLMARRSAPPSPPDITPPNRRRTPAPPAATGAASAHPARSNPAQAQSAAPTPPPPSGAALKVGMSKDALLAALGKPDRKDVIPPSDEMWFYGSRRIVLSKGKVTYIGQ